MSIDINLASVVGAAFLVLLSIIAYFLRSLADNVKRLSDTAVQTNLTLVRIDTELNALRRDVERIESEAGK